MVMLENIGILVDILFNPFLMGLMLLSVVVGITIGMIPGLNASVGVAILLPLAFGMEPIPAMLFFFGIYTGAQFGGSIAAILINTPGTTAAAATTFDGYPMTKKGEAGRALGVAAVASVVGGVVSVIGLMFFGPAFANVALSFGSAEVAAIAIFGLSLVSSVSGDSLSKGIVGTMFGVFIATIGRDPFSGYYRFTYGTDLLASGIDFIAALIGLFALSEVLLNVETIHEELEDFGEQVGSSFPSLADIRETTKVITLGSIIGVIIGMLPGSGSTLGSFVNYGVAQRIAHRGKEFGQGVIEGVAASESANNASTGGAMIPLLVLGIPGSGTTAVILGALNILDITPGPSLFEQTELIWSWFGGFFIANILLLGAAFVLLPVLVKAIEIPRHLLFSGITVLIIVGTYSLGNTLRLVWIMLAMGLIGYVFKKFDFSVGPVVLAIVLTPIIETGIRQAFSISGGAVVPIVTRPIVAVVLVLSVLTFITPVWSDIVNAVGRLRRTSS